LGKGEIGKRRLTTQRENLQGIMPVSPKDEKNLKGVSWNSRKRAQNCHGKGGKKKAQDTMGKSRV